MSLEEKIKQSYLDMVSKLDDKGRIKSLLLSLVSSDLHIIELDKQITKLEEEKRELKRLLTITRESEKNIKRQKKSNIIRVGELEVYSSDIIKTTFDYQDDDNMPYYGIPNKEIANELLVDSGLALCDWEVRVHIEVIDVSKLEKGNNAI